nr:MAG TPA: hypothetical protein [Caudoviricetes sp.]
MPCRRLTRRLLRKSQSCMWPSYAVLCYKPARR